jgi:hypothetical protein
MAIGPGKYDDLCTQIRQQAQAEGAIVIIFKGRYGNGFSAQADLTTTLKLPAILRDVAAQIENSYLESWPGQDPDQNN